MSPQKKKASVKLREIRDIKDLIDSVTMSDIQFYELTCTRNDQENNQDDVEIHPTFTLQIGHPSNGIGVRLAIEIVFAGGSARADAGVLYLTQSSEDIAPISEELGLEFVNRVGLLVLMPYLREAIANITLKVFGKPTTLPMLRAGQLTFSSTQLQDPTLSIN